MNSSRREPLSSKLTPTTYPKRRWSVVKQLIHSWDSQRQCAVTVINSFYNAISSYFAGKIISLQGTIALNSLSHVPMPPSDMPHIGDQLCSLPDVPAEAVGKILAISPLKILAEDCIPTSLMKACSQVFPELIIKLVNLFMFEGCFLS
jgi:hypothetical protein